MDRDTQDQLRRGEKLRIDMFGQESVTRRVDALGEFGKPLQHIINAYAYGDVWSRTALPPASKSLVMIAMMAAAFSLRRIQPSFRARNQVEWAVKAFLILSSTVAIFTTIGIVL